MALTSQNSDIRSEKRKEREEDTNSEEGFIRRLEWYVEKNEILSPYTVGFRKSQSCIDCLSRLVTYIQIGFSENEPTLACFLDIENAYNNVAIESVLIRKFASNQTIYGHCHPWTRKIRGVTSALPVTYEEIGYRMEDDQFDGRGKGRVGLRKSYLLEKTQQR
ncbi:hypothetical protein EVAR_12045_1 [Eumeta japonica]|uniref:Reverse transcriptase domain-containing protein n=1 Tax=Eumeta variegata TaxID=151549 RepID=A0A4C1U636_EUMVA|nr:hypothetical protein EVAR_12045_1 [Eumeta japonica]